VFFGGVLRHEQREHQADRLAVRGIESDWLCEAHQCAHGVFQALDASVGDRDALTEACGAQSLAREQALEHRAPGDSMLVLEQQANLLEQPLLARGGKIGQDIR